MERKGQYRFTVYNFGKLYSHVVTVTIVEETAKRLRIRIPVAIGKHEPGGTMWVMKKSVAEKKDRTARIYDCTEQWWNK